ncbi:PREDICTED: complement decay-accelerating factor [Odobenus rosmarus divergens]|uniref:Complement decay-accelerating factor n=1 Tax=Odobenus rosmarus divergens TaxID=9708 RepID=A0A2U3X0S2_ODORO|nr:PREDICTED: complement decay-accelerating factor [Odobenus rosmarus divergens]
MCVPGGRSAPPPLLLLLLLLGPPAAQGDCNIPPEVPNAQPTLGGLLSFHEGTTVTYKCNEGFVKVPGRADSVVCLNNKWSEVAEFCNRSCDVPTRLLFASLKKSFTKQNYFPAGFIVEYECRPGFQRDRFFSGKLICLQNFTWSKPDEFCKKKSCPNPGDLRHGHVSIPTDLLYGSSISFSCNEGYRLVGETSSYCSLVDEDVGWSDPFPKCQEIFCPEPPEISNGFILDPRDTYVYQQTIKYRCNESFTLIGKNSIYCTVRGEQGEWSGPPPECKATKPTSTPQKPTTANVPGTKATSTQKPSMANVSGTKVPSTPQKPTTINAPATKVPSTLQKSNTVNVPATEVPSTPQKPDTINSSAAEALPTPQKPTTVHVSATKTPSTPQKPTRPKDSATAKKSPISNALSTETPSAAQNPIMANASATQAMPVTHRSTTAKASFTRSLPATRKSTIIHAAVTKGLHTTKRLTSAHITAKQSSATPKTTSTPNGKGTLSSDAAIIAIGLVAGTVIGALILVKIFWHYGKSGSYYTHENNKALNVVFHNLTVTGDASEVRPSGSHSWQLTSLCARLPLTVLPVPLCKITCWDSLRHRVKALRTCPDSYPQRPRRPHSSLLPERAVSSSRSPPPSSRGRGTPPQPPQPGHRGEVVRKGRTEGHAQLLPAQPNTSCPASETTENPSARSP